MHPSHATMLIPSRLTRTASSSVCRIQRGFIRVFGFETCDAMSPAVPNEEGCGMTMQWRTSQLRSDVRAHMPMELQPDHAKRDTSITLLHQLMLSLLQILHPPLMLATVPLLCPHSQQEQHNRPCGTCIAVTS